MSEFKKFECNEERQNACARISGGPYISMVLSTKFLMVFCMKVLRVVLAKHEGWQFYVDWRCICLSKSKIWSPKCAVFARPLPMCISVSSVASCSKIGLKCYATRFVFLIFLTMRYSIFRTGISN